MKSSSPRIRTAQWIPARLEKNSLTDSRKEPPWSCGGTSGRSTGTPEAYASGRGRHLGGAVRAAPRVQRDRALALRAVARGPLVLLGPQPVALHEPVQGPHDEEEDRRGDNQEGDHRVDELAVAKHAVVDRELQRAEVGLAPDGSDQRRDQVGDQRGHDGPERRADDDTHGEVDDVPPEDELAELGQHAGDPRRAGSSPRPGPGLDPGAVELSSDRSPG